MRMPAHAFDTVCYYCYCWSVFSVVCYRFLRGLGLGAEWHPHRTDWLFDNRQPVFEAQRLALRIASSFQHSIESSGIWLKGVAVEFNSAQQVSRHV